MVSKIIRIVTLVLLGLINISNASYSQSYFELDFYDVEDDIAKINIQEFRISETEIEGDTIMVSEEYREVKRVFEDGKLIAEILHDERRSDSIAYHYHGDWLIKIEYFDLKSKWSYPDRWKQFFFIGDEIFVQNDFERSTEISATTYYRHLNVKNGVRIIEGEKINYWDSRNNSKIYIEFDPEGNLATFVETDGIDTIKLSEQVESRGGSDFKYRNIFNGHMDENYGIWWNTTRSNKRDEKQQLIEQISNSIGFIGGVYDEVSMKTTINFENYYNDGRVTGKLFTFQESNIYGEFYNDRYNVNLTLGLDGTCLVRKYDNLKDMTSKNNIHRLWSPISKEVQCNYDINSSTLIFSEFLTSEIKIKKLMDYLVLEMISPEESYSVNSKIYLKQK